MVRRAVLLGALAAAVVAAAPAEAFVPPALYVRQSLANDSDHTPKGDWIPLASAPDFAWLGGYEIGYAIQEAGTPRQLQHVALQVTAVPDGQPTQPVNLTPYCLGVIGDVGEIVPLTATLQFEGDGAYGVKVFVGPGSGGPTDCTVAGPATASSTGTFSVSVTTAPELVGRPTVFRAQPLDDDAFVGVRTDAPAGGQAETRCALDATVNADGSVSGPLVAPPADDSPGAQAREPDFTRPGAWTCVGRGTVEGIDNDYNRVTYGTPWSAPLQFDVLSDFQRVRGRIRGSRTLRPAITYTAQFPGAAAGGALQLRLRQAVGCRRLPHRRYTYRYKSRGTFGGTFDAKSATVTIRRPRVGRYSPVRWYVATLAFGGTRFITRSVDPYPSYLRVTSRGLEFQDPRAFPLCPGFRV